MGCFCAVFSRWTRPVGTLPEQPASTDTGAVGLFFVFDPFVGTGQTGHIAPWELGMDGIRYFLRHRCRRGFALCA